MTEEVQPGNQLAHVNEPAMSQAQLELLKKTLAADANLTNDELALFGQVSKRLGLDPFRGEIYVSKRGGKLTFQTGIDAFRRKAEETGLYAGQDAPEWCGKDGAWKQIWAESTNPIAARVRVYRKDWTRPIEVIAHWDEYVQKTNDGKVNRMWQQRGPSQLAKCAEALAFRKAFPHQLAGVYTDDEMAQADNPTSGRDRRADLLSAFNSLRPEARERLRQWWKDSALPVSATWPAKTLERTPEEHLDAVLAAMEALAQGTIPVPLGGDEEGPPDDEPTASPRPSLAPSDDEVIDAVVVEEGQPVGRETQAAKVLRTPSAEQGVSVVHPSPAPAPDRAISRDEPVKPVRAQLTELLRELGLFGDERSRVLSEHVGRRVRSVGGLSDQEAVPLIAELQRRRSEQQAADVVQAAFGDVQEVPEAS